MPKDLGIVLGWIVSDKPSVMMWGPKFARLTHSPLFAVLACLGFSRKIPR